MNVHPSTGLPVIWHVRRIITQKKGENFCNVFSDTSTTSDVLVKLYGATTVASTSGAIYGYQVRDYQIKREWGLFWKMYFAYSLWPYFWLVAAVNKN